MCTERLTFISAILEAIFRKHYTFKWTGCVQMLLVTIPSHFTASSLLIAVSHSMP